jgi:hypothetical protein
MADTDNASKPECFVISPIGKARSLERRRADAVLKFLIEPVFSSTHEVIRADRIHAPGLITVQIVEHVMNAAVVVADLTDRNANVHYELAIRHAIRKPYIQLIRIDQELPFDVHGMRALQYDTTDPFVLEENREQLANALKAVEAGDSGSHQSPLRSTWLGCERAATQRSRVLANIREELADLRAEVRGPRTILTGQLAGGGVFYPEGSTIYTTGGPMGATGPVYNAPGGATGPTGPTYTGGPVTGLTDADADVAIALSRLHATTSKLGAPQVVNVESPDENPEPAESTEDEDE